MPGELAIGIKVAGHRVESVIGQGGMGIVYLAEHLRLGRKVALKVLNPELARDDTFRRRFVRESQLAASLDHPNVITVYDAGEVDGILYISMRYVDGPGLDGVLRRSGRLDPKDALWVLAQVAAALDAAHAEGLVHRDVKPGNVLLRRRQDSGGFDRVYLTDFGITKNIRGGPVHTQTGQFVGTVDYMAPEQISGTSVDGRVDVYSLGCVLYQCLTGEVPFQAENLISLMYAHLQDPPPRITALRPDLPTPLDPVVQRALAKRPQDRFATSTELVDAARDALSVPAYGQRWMVAASPTGKRDHEAITVQDGRVDVPSSSVTPVLDPRVTSRVASRRRRRVWAAVASLLLVLGGGIAFAVLVAGGHAPRSPSTRASSLAARTPSPLRRGRIVWGHAISEPNVFGGSGVQAINWAITIPGRVFAVGYDSSGGDLDPAIWKFDGSGWQKANILAGLGNQGVAGIAQRGPGLVAVGTDYSGPDADAAVWVSEDGQFWQRVSAGRLRRAGNQYMIRVVKGGPGLLAVGNQSSPHGRLDAAVWASSDGRSWNLMNSSLFGGPGDQVMLSAATFRKGIVAVGDSVRGGDMDAAVWRYDGKTWTRATSSSLGGFGKQQITAVAKDPRGLVAVGFDESGHDRDAAVWTSADGLHWRRIHSPALGGAGYQSMAGVTWTPAGFIAAGSDAPAGATWSSPYGRGWHEDTLQSPGGFPRVAAVAVFRSKVFALGRILSGGQADAAVWPGKFR